MHNLWVIVYFDCIYFHNYNECVNILLIEWGWMVAGAAPGLQIRVSGRRTFRGVFDSHASPPIYGYSKLRAAARSCLF